MRTTNKLLHTLTLALLIIASLLALSSCNSTISIENKINKLLEDDLNSSVEIIKLYYNEEEQGCFVEFQTSTYTDKAAIHLDTGLIEYESEFDYYAAKAEELRNQNPINENELHKYNQKIIDSSYPYWSFSVTVFEADGRPEDSDWERIK